MNSIRKPIITKDIKSIEKVNHESGIQINGIFADILISFVTQVFIVRKKDAFVDTKLTRMVLEEEIE
jgi:hypothetical protein